MRHDLWFALRRLRLRPLHSAVIALTLGLGLGAALAVFAVVDAVLVRPLPYDDAAQLVRVARRIPVAGLPEIAFSDVGYRRLVSDARTLTSIAAFNTRDVNLTGRGSPRRLTTARVTASLFDVLRVRPVVGRAFTADEDVPNGRRVVVLSDWLWRAAFGANPGVIGSAAILDGEPFTIVGVLAPSTSFPSRDIGAWEPLRVDPAAVNPYNAPYGVVARMKPGMSHDDVARDLVVSIREVGKQFPGPHAGSALDLAGFKAIVHSLADDVVGDARPVVVLLLAGVSMLLLLTCANVANLQLANAVARGEELAVRAALGATRARLIRGALIEGMLLAGAGAAVGLTVAAAAARLLATLMPRGVAFDGSLIGARSLVVTVVVVIIVGAIVGALPVALSARRDAALALRDRTDSGHGASPARVRRLLAAAQVALAVLLLHGSGLLIASARTVQQVQLGFRPDSTMSLRINLTAEKLRDRTTREMMLRRIVAEAEQIPGVTAAALVNALPLTLGRRDQAMALEGRPFRADGSDPVADYRVITSRYFDVMGMRVVKGRVFTDDDANARYTPLVISEGLAREIWGDANADPIGQRLRFGPNAPWMPIVGVVSDAKNRSLIEPARPEFYAPGLATWANLAFQSEITLIVRSATDPRSLIAQMRRVVGNVDPEIPTYEIASLRDVVRDSRAPMLTATRLMSAYAVAALLLAVAGTYAVLSYLVTQRRRELAVRMALGASPGEIVALVARESGMMIGTGVVVGLVSALALARLLAGLLYGVGALDVRVVAGVVVVASVSGVIAATLPARRAARVDPAAALRASG
ncbi:MAG TPA: ADOP family duplicated permease [Gemmatimonadaceae bacterium]|nr:ADOP family duplicated permease [Gemmatimonadaceae bacterium]